MRRLVVRLVVVVATCSAVVACGDQAGQVVEVETAEGSRTIMTLPEGEDVELLAVVSGVLAWNDKGCLSVADEVVVALHGTRIGPDGETVTFPGAGEFSLGDSVTGTGGHLTSKATIDRMIDRIDLAAAARSCDAHGAGVVLFDPS